MKTGRFAPSPSGRMHMGNIFTALISWLSVRKEQGKWILRIEDLDPQRSKKEFALQIEDDLRWLGLDWDEGGLEDNGPSGPYSQSRRHEFYEQAFQKLKERGLTYDCRCTRAELNATNAPHDGENSRVYAGTCRPLLLGGPALIQDPDKPVRATRLYVPDKTITFHDKVFGATEVNLAREFGDFILRRADGAWAYQLAVTVDDALMGVTEVVRGVDLLPSAAAQIYLYELFGYPAPEFMHVPLICNDKGIRLSKRDLSLSMETIRRESTPQQVIGFLGYMAGILPEPFPISAEALLTLYTPSVIPKSRTLTLHT